MFLNPNEKVITEWKHLEKTVAVLLLLINVGEELTCSRLLNNKVESSYRTLRCCSVQFSSIAQLCPTLSDPMKHSTSGLPVHHQLPKFIQTHVHWVADAIQHLILCHPLLLLPPIPLSISVFSNESTLRIRWPKYWTFSFSISPSSEHTGLISFRMDSLDLLAVQGS